RVDGDALVMRVGRDLETSREVRAVIPQFGDLSAQVEQAETAALRSEMAVEQVMNLVKDAAQVAADQVSVEAEQYAALA
ncbi:hypothetical protein ACXWSQ_09320, partial [Streptococcus pyogenes]